MIAITTGAVAEPVSASEPETPIVFGQPLDELLSKYPDAKPLGDGSYQLQPGVRLVPPMDPSEIGVNEWPSGCDDQWFCVYDMTDFAGWSEWYYECYEQYVPDDLGISSMHNAQNSYRAYFYDTDVSPMVYGSLGPNSYWRNMAKNTASDGRSWNNRIDKVDPC